MLSKGGKREYFCPECRSPNIGHCFSYNQSSYWCSDCGHWGPWRTRINKKPLPVTEAERDALCKALECPPLPPEVSLEIDPRTWDTPPDYGFDRFRTNNPNAMCKDNIAQPEPVSEFLVSPCKDNGCEGCSCHINPPCSHCVDHKVLVDTLTQEEINQYREEGWVEE